jgi:hypothetical protein
LLSTAGASASTLRPRGVMQCAARLGDITSPAFFK